MRKRRNKYQKVTQILRYKILARDGYRCVYCGYKHTDKNKIETLVIDHIVPVICGGTNNEFNLITACRTCNSILKDRLFNTLAERVEWIRNKRMAARKPRHKI